MNTSNSQSTPLSFQENHFLIRYFFSKDSVSETETFSLVAFYEQLRTMEREVLPVHALPTFSLGKRYVP